MNPPYEQRRDGPRPIIITPRQHDFTCEACRLPGVSESRNAKYHQTRDCKIVQLQRAIARRKRSGR